MGHETGSRRRVVADGVSPGMETASDGRGGREGERRATLRVLLVDDLPEIRYLLEVALSRQAKVRLVGQAEDGRQALEKIELLRPDLVVMDLQMPVMNGLEATRRIKQRWPLVEVVGFTSSNPDAPDAMREAGATQSFTKGELKLLLEFIRGRAASRSSVSAG